MLLVLPLAFAAGDALDTPTEDFPDSVKSAGLVLGSFLGHGQDRRLLSLLFAAASEDAFQSGPRDTPATRDDSVLQTSTASEDSTLHTTATRTQQFPDIGQRDSHTRETELAAEAGNPAAHDFTAFEAAPESQSQTLVDRFQTGQTLFSAHDRETAEDELESGNPGPEGSFHSRPNGLHSRPASVSAQDRETAATELTALEAHPEALHRTGTAHGLETGDEARAQSAAATKHTDTHSCTHSLTHKQTTLTHKKRKAR